MLTLVVLLCSTVFPSGHCGLSLLTVLLAHRMGFALCTFRLWNLSGYCDSDFLRSFCLPHCRVRAFGSSRRPHRSRCACAATSDARISGAAAGLIVCATLVLRYHYFADFLGALPMLACGACTFTIVACCLLRLGPPSVPSLFAHCFALPF